jgi:hypothetical protein
MYRSRDVDEFGYLQKNWVIKCLRIVDSTFHSAQGHVGRSNLSVKFLVHHSQLGHPIFSLLRRLA